MPAFDDGGGGPGRRLFAIGGSGSAATPSIDEYTRVEVELSRAAVLSSAEGFDDGRREPAVCRVVGVSCRSARPVARCGRSAGGKVGGWSVWW